MLPAGCAKLNAPGKPLYQSDIDRLPGSFGQLTRK
jgi:hypothetical protein